MRQAPVGTVTANLISLQFSPFQSGCVDCDAAHQINFASQLEGVASAVPEERRQHFYDVLIGVIVIIQQYNVIQGEMQRDLLLLLFSLLFGRSRCL